MVAVKPQQMVSEWFQKAAETCDAAMKMGVKCQEETMQWWSEALSETGSMQGWQKKAQGMATNAIPICQKNAEDYLKAIDQSYRNGLDLLKRAFENGEFQSMEDLQAKVQSLWEATLGSVRTSTQAIIQANTRAMETWAEFVRKNADVKPQPAGAS